MIWQRDQAVRAGLGHPLFSDGGATASKTPGITRRSPWVVAAGARGSQGALAGPGVGAVLFLDFADALPFLATAVLIFTTPPRPAGEAGWKRTLVPGGGGVALFLAVSGIYVIQSCPPLRNLAPCLAAMALVGISAWYYQPLLQDRGSGRSQIVCCFWQAPFCWRWWT